MEQSPVHSDLLVSIQPGGRDWGGTHNACRGGPSRKTKKTVVRFPVALEEVRYIPYRSDLVQDDNEESALAKKKGVHFSVARQRQRGGVWICKFDLHPIMDQKSWPSARPGDNVK